MYRVLYYLVSGIHWEYWNISTGDKGNYYNYTWLFLKILLLITFKWDNLGRYLAVDWQKLQMPWMVEMEVGQSVTYFLTASGLISSRMNMCFLHLLLATELCQPAHSYVLCWFSSAFGIFSKVYWISGSQISGSILCWGTLKTKVNSPDTLNLSPVSLYQGGLGLCSCFRSRTGVEMGLRYHTWNTTPWQEWH